MSGMKVLARPARPEDYEAVLSIIPDLYGGSDYMPHKYHSYFSDPKAHPFVGEVDGRVVSFCNYYVLDNGHTAVATGARTVKEYQGMHIGNKVHQSSLHAALCNYPNLKVEARVVIDSDFYKQYRKPNAKGVIIIHEQVFLQYLTTQKDLLGLLNHLEKTTPVDRDRKTHPIDSETAAKSLPKILLGSNLFLDKSFLTATSYLPLRATKDNLAYACRSTNVVVSSENSSTKCTGVSFAVCPIAKIGPSLTIFFYVQSIDDLFHHLKLHLQRNKEKFLSGGEANIDLAFPLKLPLNEVKQRVFPFLGVNLADEFTTTETIMIVERPIKKAKAKI